MMIVIMIVIMIHGPRDNSFLGGNRENLSFHIVMYCTPSGVVVAFDLLT